MVLDDSTILLKGALTFGVYHMYLTTNMINENNKQIQLKFDENYKNTQLKFDENYKNTQLKFDKNKH